MTCRLPNLLQETLNAVESAKAGSGKSETEVLIGGMDKQLAMLATASAAKGKQAPLLVDCPWGGRGLRNHPSKTLDDSRDNESESGNHPSQQCYC